MEQRHRNIITQNLKNLSEHINFELLVPLLLEKKIFTRPMMEDIQAEKTNTDRKNKLLTELCTRGPSAFQNFIYCLRQTDQFSAVHILLADNNDNSAIENEQMGNNEVDSHVEQSGGTHKDQSSIIEAKVRLAEKWNEGYNIYKMSKNPRGLCLIINNEDFQGIKDKRKGSEIDVVKLEKVFQQLSFIVESHRNKKAMEMMDIIEEFSTRLEHHKYDCCIVIIMSHGDRDVVYGSDSYPVYLEKIYEHFNNADCHPLINKPKIFFLQACRGAKYDVGTEMPKYLPVHADGSLIGTAQGGTTSPAYDRLPTWSDMLIAYCTIPGYTSLRNEAYGSWFIQFLVDALMRRAWDTDLRTILEEVDGNVQQQISDKGDKQTPEIISRGFTKKLYFNPGLFK